MPLYRYAAFAKVLAQCNRSSTIFLKHSEPINNCRHLATDPHKALTTKKALKHEKEKFRTYIFQRYMDYVSNYTKVLNQRFPSAMKLYRVFSVGIKDFYKDLKMYISIRIKVAKDNGFKNMTRQDIELYHKMPNDMLRVAPVLILSTIPFGNYVIFPLAFLKPRTLLSSHFWSLQQRSEFSVLDLTDRLRFNRPVFRELQAKLDSIEDDHLREKFKYVIQMIGSGVHPKPDDVLQCIKLFSEGPFSLKKMSYKHKGQLLKVHGLRKSLFRTSKLQYHAFLLWEMDKAILKEGGVENLNIESLANACRIRGLNSNQLSRSDMVTWLNHWLQISKNIDKSSYSLLLHGPIFLAYNHPQNWVLIY